MKETSHRLQLATALAVLLTSTIAQAQTNVWSGASTPDLSWLTSGNWFSAAVPGPTDAAVFFDTGAATDLATVNNTVPANMTVGSLWYGQTNGYHNTQIAAGATLTISNTAAGNAILVGTETTNTVTQVVSNTMSGLGRLTVQSSNANLLIRQGHASSGAHLAALDMSGLETFNANLGRILVGVGDSALRRAEGRLVLARTNTLTLTGSGPQLVVGDNSGNNNGNSSVSRMWLGQKTTMYLDAITVGGQKQQGNLSFGTFTSPSLYVRGTNVTNRATTLAFGDGSGQSASGNPTTGTVDLNAGTVDVKADTLYLARGQTGTGSGTTGFLTIGAGTMDVNNLHVGYQNAAGAVGAINATLTVNNNGLFGSGATLIVNSNLTMARSAGSTAANTATLNIGGGTVLANGTFSIGGTANINITNGLLRLPGGSRVVANNVTVDGGTLTNAAVIAASNTLSVVNGGVITGSPLFDMGNSGTAMWTFMSGVTISNALQGSGMVSGDVTQAPGATLNPGGSGLAGSLTLFNNLTLSAGNLLFDLSSSGVGVNDQILASGNLALAGTNNVWLRSLGGAFDTANPYLLISSGALLSGDATYFRVAGPLASSRYTFAFDTTSTPGQVKLVVSGAGSANLRWVGDGTANTWDLAGAANWNNGVGPDKFYNLDAVTFDDSGSASPALNLVGTLIPASITMNNALKSYTLNGSGALGGGNLTNFGTGTLTFNNAGSNSFSNVDIENGAVVFGGGGANDFSAGAFYLNSGASATLANAGINLFGMTPTINGTLTFNQSADSSTSLAPYGSGTLRKQGSGVLTLGGDYSFFSGTLQINAGVLRAGSKLVLSPINTVNSGGTLDVNGFNLGTTTVTASGAGAGGIGAIVNNGTAVYPALANVTLAGHTTFGGTGRWDLRAAGGTTGDPGTASLNTGAQALNLTKTGTNQVGLCSITVDDALADIDVQQGILQIEGNTTSLGNPARTLTVRAGATLQFYRCTNLLNKAFVLYGDGATTTVNNSSQTNTMIGPVTLNGNCIFNAGGNYLTNAGPIAGTGSLIKSGGSTLVLGGAATYSGGTTLSNGTLVVSASLGGSGVTTYGGTLSGTGPINAPVSVVGGTLSPMGGTLGTMSVANSLSLAGTCAMDFNKTGAVLTSDRIQGITTLTCGGTLRLNLTGDPLAAGDSFTLFQFGSATGAFATITPATPAAGLVWDTSRLTVDGTLSVRVPPAKIGAVAIIGSDVVISGSGGTPGANYYVLSSTNVALPMANWTPLATNMFDPSGNFSATNALDPSVPQRYYRLQLP